MPVQEIWRKRVGYIADGEPVSAPVTNRPSRDLEANLDAVRERAELAEAGTLLIAFDAALDAACVVGTPVVLVDGVYTPAAVDPGAGLFRADGVVRSKLSAKVGDVTLVGLDEIDLSAVTDDTAAGLYYLSATAGRLTASPPAWPVPVLVRNADGTVLVFAASQTAVGSAHNHETVYVAHHRSEGLDAGWQVVTGGEVGRPAGATYRYANSDAVDRIAALSVPGTAWSVTEFNGWGRGTELDDTVVQLNAGGLWWSAAFPPGDYTDSSSSAGGGPARLRLSAFVSPYATAAVVRTLVSADPTGPLRVLNCDGTEDPYGNLKIEYDGTREIARTDQPGGEAFKGFQADGRVLAGPVVEGLRAADSSVVLTGSTRPVDPDEPAGDQMYAGVVELRANLNPDGRVVLPQTVRIDDLRQRYSDGVYYLGMPADRTSSSAVKFRLPGTDALPEGATLTFSALLLVDASGTLPALTLEYKRLPRPADLGSETPPASFTALPFPASGQTVVAGDYLRVDADPISALEADEIVVFLLTRSGPDGFAGEVGLLDMVCELNAP